MPLNDKKKAYAAKLVDYIEENKCIFIVHADNVGSKQMQQIRITLRGQAHVLMGKNTTVRKVIKDFLKTHEGHPIGNILDHVYGNIGFVFTNGDLAHIRDVIQSNKVPAPARVASICPSDVYVEPGPTGCDPGQTMWFQALNIPTKINKGQIEMISRVHLIKQGDKVTESQAALLQKLAIKPFSYGLIVKNVYDNGDIFEPAVLDIKPEDMFSKLATGIRAIAAVGLAAGYPTKASLTHSINNAYKALISVHLGTDYKFPRAQAFEDFLANPANFVVAASSGGGGGGGGAAAAEAKKEESEEESAGGGGAGGLFGNDDDF